MKKIALFTTTLLLMLTTAIHAHGPVRGKMTARVTIDAPTKEIWDIIKNYDDMSWLPEVKNVTTDKGNKKGSIRVLTLNNGETVTEELKAYKADAMSYKYKIIKMSSVKTIQHVGQDEAVPVLPVENYAATLSVKENAGKSIVTWVATYYRAYVNNNPPEELNEAAADQGVQAILTSGLTSLLKKFDPQGDQSAVTITIKR
jgi:mxaD protein